MVGNLYWDDHNIVLVWICLQTGVSGTYRLDCTSTYIIEVVGGFPNAKVVISVT